MKILPRLSGLSRLWFRHARRARGRAGHPLSVVVDIDLDEEPPGACGWYDSSHALQQGLVVREHASPEATAAELPLGPWLELHLAGWQPGRAGA